MKKFKFKLQVVLEKREKELQDRQLELSQIQLILNKQQAELERLINLQDTTKANLDSMLSSGENIDLMSVRIHQEYIDKLSGDIQNQHKIIADTQEALEEKQLEVVEAMKKAKMLEKLKEKHYRAFLAEFEAQNEKELEDVTSARFRLKAM